jgi:hypothetical protein
MAKLKKHVVSLDDIYTVEELEAALKSRRLVGATQLTLNGRNCWPNRRR